MKVPEYLTFKYNNMEPLSRNVIEQMSPIPIKASPLMQQYQKKTDKFFQAGNPYLNFDNIQTPGWSSVVETEQPETRRTVPSSSREQILRKITEQVTMDNPNSRSLKYSNQNKPYSESNSYARLKVPPPGMKMASELTQRSRDLRESKTHRTSESVKRLPKKGDECSRFRQISVHDHLYLDSKRQQARKMMQKIVDEECQKNIMSFKPQISQYSQLLAQNRFKKVNQDPDYRCTKKKVQNRKSSSKVHDQSEIQMRCLHNLFLQIAGGEPILSRGTLSVDNIPLPCLRSIEPLLQEVFMGASLTWINFLNLFNSKGLNRRTLFQLLKDRQRRTRRGMTDSKMLQAQQESEWNKQ